MKKHLFLVFILISLTISSTVLAQFTTYNTSNSNLVSDYCARVGVDAGGFPWIGHTYDGASVLDSTHSSFINYNSSNSPLTSGFMSFVMRDGNLMWVADYDNGLFFYNVDHFASISTLPDYSIYGLYKTGNDLWIATKNFGIMKYNMTNMITQVFNEYNVLPTNYILRITGDTAGNIYAGTGTFGALKFDGYNWTVYDTYNSMLPGNNVYSVACDKKGNAWFGTYEGLAKLTPAGDWTIYDSVTSGLPSNYIRTIVIRDSMLVAATGYGGLGILNMNTDAWTVFNTDNSNIPSNGVWDAAISDNGDIWIVGLASGLSVLPGYLTTSVNQVRADNPFRVYPNPADKVLQVDYTGKEKATYTLSLVATDGGDKLIVTGYTSTGIIQKTLDVSGVAPGAYLLRITGQKIMATTKLVIK